MSKKAIKCYPCGACGEILPQHALGCVVPARTAAIRALVSRPQNLYRGPITSKIGESK